MANIYKGTLGLIGNTPIVEVTNIEKDLGLEAKILVKLEYFNPAGSVKDRIAKAMLDDAEEQGKLKEGSVIIEPTSGNTGILVPAISKDTFFGTVEKEGVFPRKTFSMGEAFEKRFYLEAKIIE